MLVKFSDDGTMMKCPFRYRHIPMEEGRTVSVTSCLKWFYHGSVSFAGVACKWEV